VAKPALLLMIFLEATEVLVAALLGGRVVVLAVSEQQVEIMAVIVLPPAANLNIMLAVAAAVQGLQEHLLVVQVFCTQGPGVRELPTLLQELQELVAVAGYNLFVAKSCHAHFCILPGEKMTKDFLWFAHYFPFVQAGCAVIVALVEIANVRIRRLMKKSGYVDLATIDEGGVMVSVLHKKDCRFLDIRG